MSARNGDKSRYQINRKRAVQRRTKIRELVKASKGGPAPTGESTDEITAIRALRGAIRDSI